MKSETQKNNFLFISGCLAMILFIFPKTVNAQTVVHGVVRDSVTNEPIPYVTIRFENSTIGTSSENDGTFIIKDLSKNEFLIISEVGYRTKRIKIPVDKKTELNVKMQAEEIQLSEVIVKPRKQKYSKKNNPAVELLKKVIEHKFDNIPSSRDYYSNNEYERIVFSINDYQPQTGLLKNMKFLSNYSDTSLIDGKPILPFSVRETISNIYYRKNPKNTRRVVKAYNVEGIDQNIDVESLDGIMKENFQDISITDNNIYFLKHNFVSPLNNSLSANFYRWYIVDTVQIDKKKYVNLGFVPFNVNDVGFIGNIYVQPDFPYAIKRVSFRVPSQINMGHVEKMLYTQEFEEQSSGVWLPLKFTAAIDFSYLDIAKIYVAKEKTYANFDFMALPDSTFSNPAQTSFSPDYNKQSDKYWDIQRTTYLGQKDYKLRNMMKELQSNRFFNFLTKKASNVLLTGYASIDEDLNKNKLDIGTLLTFFSYNQLEGARFRLTTSTTKNLHPHLFLYSYAAYGTKDHKLKYNGELTWSFNERKYHKDEFPKNNLSLAYKYDVNQIGQQFLWAERDNIIMSFRVRPTDNMTYSRILEANYIHEYYSGLSFNIFGRIRREEAAGNLFFTHLNDLGTINNYGSLNYNEFGVKLRYAHNEKFYQKRLIRKPLPSQGAIFTFTHTIGIKNLFGGQFDYQKTILSIEKEFWITPFGRISTAVTGEKVWNAVPFPLLSMAYANTSITFQPNTFNLIKPMEFPNDAQLTWDITYRLDGWLFNRIPLINKLKWREIVGFKGIWGSLSQKNNPINNNSLMLFPSASHVMTNTPYMEYSVGIENIFQLFRIDYVRRINYLNMPGVRKDGLVVSLNFTL
ncbi:MAG: DUF5686 family protein [Dysgonamonadaceae bacterium]|nr:DUF5686 family protein [Dysgonamonadaceae bacterium]MDD3901587.1 DUF5686 family protein [Dysgonamonadaceae bacterium]MDD4400080.1 DUF5686 family protein [Dysgonamonadaceae bacterium]